WHGPRLVGNDLQEDLAVLPGTIEFGVGDVLPATERELTALDVQDDRLVDQHLPHVAGAVEAVLVARPARVQGTAVRVEVAVVLDRLRQEIDEVIAEVGLARLLDGNSQRGVEGVEEERAVVDAGLSDAVANRIRDTDELGLGVGVVREDLLI